MRVLLTGGCGFIGSNLIRHLLAETDHRLINLDKLTYAANPTSLAELADSPRYRLSRTDLRDARATWQAVAASDADAVIHLAAESHVDRSIDGPSVFLETNVLGTFHLLESSRRHWSRLPADRRQRFRFIHVSTDEVYGSLGDTGTFSETSCYDPHSPYAASKAASDHLARAWQTTYGLPVIVTNSSNNYGPYQFPEKLIPLTIVKALRGEPLPVYGDGRNMRDWIYVEDHARALAAVLQRGVAGETYTIGADQQRRTIEVVRSICSILDEMKPRADGKPHAEAITYVADRPGHDYRYALDARKISEQLGWAPRVDFQTRLRETVRWYLENPQWWQRVLGDTYQLQRLGTGDPPGEAANGGAS